jgi:hypothetical protein
MNMRGSKRVLCGGGWRSLDDRSLPEQKRKFRDHVFGCGGYDHWVHYPKIVVRDFHDCAPVSFTHLAKGQLVGHPANAVITDAQRLVFCGSNCIAKRMRLLLRFAFFRFHNESFLFCYSRHRDPHTSS